MEHPGDRLGLAHRHLDRVGVEGGQQRLGDALGEGLDQFVLAIRGHVLDHLEDPAVVERVADAVARWTAAVEREGAKVISPRVREVVSRELRTWRGEQMPLDGAWIDAAIEGLVGEERAIARLAIVVAKASYRTTDSMVDDVMGEARDQARFIRILAWSSFTAARHFARIVAERSDADAPAVAKLQPANAA